MTIQELLKMPDSDIAKSGILVKQVFNEYRDLTKLTPQFCDCQLRVYLNFLRQYYGITIL